jgi:hypothetical protein
MKSQKSHKEKKGRVLLIRSSAQNSLAFYFCMCGRRSNWKVLVVIIPVIIIMFHHRQLFFLPLLLSAFLALRRSSFLKKFPKNQRVGGSPVATSPTAIPF